MKKIFNIVILCAVAVSAAAVPARRDGVVRVQSDGSEITVYQHGDEFFHYLTNEQGEWLEEDAKGDLHVVSPLSEEAIVARRAESKFAKPVRRATSATQASTDRLLAPRGAVILVNFTDQAFQSTKEEMVEWAMSDSFPTGSIHKYFMDVSYGQYDLQLDIFGPVTVSKESTYYGQNDSRGDDKYVDVLIKEACQLAAANEGADFSKYDYNNDGKVDWVVVLYAGKGEADGGSASTIWPHQYKLSYTGKAFNLNGKTVDHYCCLQEIDGQTEERAGIGTFCHEFSHVMGLPDLYTTLPKLYHKTMGSWDIMDYGPYNNDGNTPPAYSAYERWWMGWIEPTLLTGAGTISLQTLNKAKAAAYLTENGTAISNILSPSPSTFYMLEYRVQTGWDKYLPGRGLIVTKIKYNLSKWANNVINNDPDNMGVDLIEADGSAPSYPNKNYFGKAGDAYPQGDDAFTDVENYQITDIRFVNGLLTFDLNGGDETTVLDVQPVADGQTAMKVIRNGKLVIVRENYTYDLLGRMLDR